MIYKVKIGSKEITYNPLSVQRFFKITVTQQRQIEGLQERQEVLTDQLQEINNYVHYPGG